MESGWYKQDLPGVGQKQARLGQTSGRLSQRRLPASGLSHLLSQEPLPFQTHSGDNASLGGLGVITNRFHIQIQLVEEKLLLWQPKWGWEEQVLAPEGGLQGAWDRDWAREGVAARA